MRDIVQQVRYVLYLKSFNKRAKFCRDIAMVVQKAT